MNIGNRFRCYPNRSQADILGSWIGCQRFIYNSKIQEDRYFRQFLGKSLSLTGVKSPIDQKYSQFKSAETDFLKEVPSQVLRNGSYRFMTGYTRFFKGLAGRPNIRKKHDRQSVLLTKELFRFEKADEEGYFKLIIGTKKFPIGEIKYKRHRAHGVPKSIYIAREGGQWFLSFSSDNGEDEYSDAEIGAWLKTFSSDELSKMTVGGDRGVVSPLVISDNAEFVFSEEQKSNLVTLETQKKRQQRKMSRRIKGSRRYNIAKERRAVIARREANIRKDFAHKASRSLVDDPRYYLFVLEDLKIKNMTRSSKGSIDKPGKNITQKSGLNRSILASAWGQIDKYLSYKARQQHKLLIKIAPHGTSQECDFCGHTHPDNRFKQSEFICQSCGFKANADDNASKIIKKRGIRFFCNEWSPKTRKKIKFTKSKDMVKDTAGRVEICDIVANARGETVRRHNRKIITHDSVNRETPTTMAFAD